MWRSNLLSYRTGGNNPAGYRNGGKNPAPRKPCFGISQQTGTRTKQGTNLAILKCNRSRKEVFQPHLPVRLPCYDLAPITGFTLGRPLRLRTSGTPGFHGLTGGVYKARERIHRAMADARLLANPPIVTRVWPRT